MAVKGRLSHKLFLGIFFAINTTFSISFLAIDYLLPHWYAQAYKERLSQLIEEFGERLEEAPLVEVGDLINDFAFENHSFVTLQSEVDGIALLFWDPDRNAMMLGTQLGLRIPVFVIDNEETQLGLTGRNFEIIQNSDGIFINGEKPMFLEEEADDITFDVEGSGIIEITRTSQDFRVTSQRIEVETLKVQETFTNEIDGVQHFLSIEASMAPVHHVLGLIQDMAPYLFVFVLMISLIIAFMMAYSLSRPIVRISQTSRKMKNLELETRCGIKRKDEIGELAQNLDIMADKLAVSMNHLTEANGLLQREMAKEKERQKQRKDFFLAVSHELKTPLMILKSQLSGMIGEVGVYQDRDLYLTRAYDTTESMADLVNKLLKISQLNSDEINLNLQTYDLGELVAESCQAYEQLAAERRISLTHFCAENLKGDVDKTHFELVLSNLISNALMYTPKGQLVDIQLEQDGNEAILTIENYGAHLSEEDFQSLFEPFYRTDKSRNRNSGGNGLGLYLVKSILELHHFSYALKNSERGVVFTIKIPLLD